MYSIEPPPQKKTLLNFTQTLKKYTKTQKTNQVEENNHKIWEKIPRLTTTIESLEATFA